MSENKEITKDDVLYVADLARLNVSEEEIDSIQSAFQDVVNFVGQLSEIDTEGVEPTNHAIAVSNVFREDEVQPSYDRAKMLSNAPSQEAGCYTVPKVIE